MAGLRILAAVAAVAGASWVWGCGDDGATFGPGEGAGGGATGSNGAGAGSSGNAQGGTSGAGLAGQGGGAWVPDFDADIVPILEAGCGTKDNKCHSAVAYHASQEEACRGWLTLVNAPLGSVFPDGDKKGQPTGCPDRSLYDRLLDLDAWQCGPPGVEGALIRYVEPCKPEASYLYNKMAGAPICKKPTGELWDKMPPDKPAESNAVTAVKLWIEAGAPANGVPAANCGGGGGAGPASTGAGNQDQLPVPKINHPGDMETRPANKPVPFIGDATDPQDGPLGPEALSWSSDLDGLLGTGKQFEKLLSAGTHTITLEAKDSDGNVGSVSITLYMQ
jgi:hypothetical protein